MPDFNPFDIIDRLYDEELTPLLEALILAKLSSALEGERCFQKLGDDLFRHGEDRYNDPTPVETVNEPPSQEEEDGNVSSPATTVRDETWPKVTRPLSFGDFEEKRRRPHSMDANNKSPSQHDAAASKGQRFYTSHAAPTPRQSGIPTSVAGRTSTSKVKPRVTATPLHVQLARARLAKIRLAQESPKEDKGEAAIEPHTAMDLRERSQRHLHTLYSAEM